MRWWDDITDSMDISYSKLGDGERQENLVVLQSMGSQRVGHDLLTEQQQ